MWSQPALTATTKKVAGLSSKQAWRFSKTPQNRPHPPHISMITLSACIRIGSLLSRDGDTNKKHPAVEILQGVFI